MVLRVPGGHESRILVTDIAKEWLARSGQLPLSIRVRAFYSQPVSELADIINQYSTRWSNLDLSMPPHCYQHLHATDNHAPTLKFIKFHSVLSANTMDLSFQLTCPRLERAFLSFFRMDGTDIQWDNLTHLTLHFMLINDSFIILRKTLRLVFCQVSGAWLGYRQQNIGTPVLTSLRSFTASYHDS
jgi:hypothetical protein